MGHPKRPLRKRWCRQYLIATRHGDVIVSAQKVWPMHAFSRAAPRFDVLLVVTLHCHAACRCRSVVHTCGAGCCNIVQWPGSGQAMGGVVWSGSGCSGQAVGAVIRQWVNAKRLHKKHKRLRLRGSLRTIHALPQQEAMDLHVSDPCYPMIRFSYEWSPCTLPSLCENIARLTQCTVWDTTPQAARIPGPPHCGLPFATFHCASDLASHGC